jgi:hypothetical protein
MIQPTRQPHYFIPLAYTLLRLLGDALRFVCLGLRPNPALAAENLFLRKQLALYQERHVIPQRTTHEGSATQVMLCPKCFAQTILIFNMLRSSTNPASITCVALPKLLDIQVDNA